MNKTTNFWLFGISLILLGASLFVNISNTIITNESIVLVFVGILATFIVVGNFAQVSEIRNTTNSQIVDLELKTQKKIDELKILYSKTTEAFEKINLIERKTNYNTAEAYRLYGIITYDKKKFRSSTTFFLNSIFFYIKAESHISISDSMLNQIIESLQPEIWNNPENYEYFNYSAYLDIVKTLPDTYNQKQKIIELLVKYKNEEKK